VATGGDGNATFNVNLPLPPEGVWITATATDPSGNTSEFCPCRESDSPIQPRLTIAIESGQVVVRWTGNFILQSAPTVPFVSPGTDVPSATSPYYPTQAVQQFFRLRAP
jgi:hypothetical protein